QVTGARAGFANPSRTGLRRYAIANMLQGEQDVFCAIFNTILITRYNTPASLSIINILALVVYLCTHGVQTFNEFFGHRRYFSQPDGSGNNQYISVLYALK